MLKVLRNKPHVLSASEETLLARGAEVLSASEQTYGLLTNADMAFPDIPGPDGNPLPLTEGTYRRLHDAGRIATDDLRWAIRARWCRS